MLELDDGEDFIGEVIDEIVSGTLSIIYDKYIEKQLLPYTVSQAKEALLTIIDVSIGCIQIRYFLISKYLIKTCCFK